jgi:hypothetical protein
MAAAAPSPARRRSWHPVTVATALTAAALGLACAASAATGPAWLVLGVWLLMGAASGFATSGST